MKMKLSLLNLPNLHMKGKKIKSERKSKLRERGSAALSEWVEKDRPA